MKTVPLTNLITGYVDNRGKTVPTVDEGIPLIATNCIKEVGLYPIFEKLRYVSKETYSTWFRGHPEPFDIILVNKGTPGLVCFVPDPVTFCFAQDMIALKVDEEIINKKYLFAYMRSKFFKDQVSALVVGTTIPHLKKTDLKRIQIPLPSRKIQNYIGNLYFDMTNKIEINRSMNQTLEDICRTIYKHWFVDFGPFQEDEFMPSEVGEIPKGWKVVSLKEVVKINERNLPKNPPFDEIEYIDISSVDIGSLNGVTIYSIKDAPSRAKRLVQDGDVIWSTVRPNRKSYMLIDSPKENTVVSTGFVVMTPITIPSSYLYSHVTTENFVSYLTSNATGSAYPAVRADKFGDAKILFPPFEVLEKFDTQVSQIRKQIALNNRELNTIEDYRDYLLPLLLTGVIDFKNEIGLLKEV